MLKGRHASYMILRVPGPKRGHRKEKLKRLKKRSPAKQLGLPKPAGGENGT